MRLSSGCLPEAIPFCHCQRNISLWEPLTTTEADVAHSLRLELFCRLFLGLFVGFFCVTAALFVRDKWAVPLPHATVVQPKGAPAPRVSSVSPGSAPAVSIPPAARFRPTTPPMDAAEKTLLASSASTFVTFIAAAVASFLNWKTNARGRRARKSGAPRSRPSRHSH